MAEIRLTEHQQAVVENRGGALLVSAAAGSGKTKVLVDRLLRYLTDPDAPCNIDEFLMITYTKAAASELRGKINAEITRRLARNPDNRHLQRQLTRIHLAQISTVHAFCTTLLRRFAAQCDLPPDFRVCEQTQADTIRQEVFQSVLEEAYRQQSTDAALRAMIDQLGFGRDDRRLQALCFSCYDAIRCRRDAEGWMARALAACQNPGALSESVWGKFWLDKLQQALGFAAENLQKALALLPYDDALNEKYTPLFEKNLSQVQTLAVQTGWDAVRENRIADFGRLPPVRACENEEIKLRAQKLRKDALAAIRDAQRALYADEQTVRADLLATSPAIEGLWRLLQSFDEAFTREKRRRKLLDFSDLEHEAIRLLVKKDGTPTAAAREVAAQYREILVDEYQDSNEVQECIFEAVSQGGQNRFLVGDVKQSIYRFRLADPGIFLQKYEQYPLYTDAAPGRPRKILLSDNFRSRKEVLAAANDVFSLCMQGEDLELRYTDAEKLRAGLSYPETPTPKVELCCIDLDAAAQEGEQSPEKREVEAQFVAGKIRALLDAQTPVTDGGALRPVRPGDIVILMRSPGQNAASYQKALGSVGIAASCDRGESIFESTEVQVLTAILQIIDNPHRDVPLVTALASPVFAVSPEELAHLRAAQRTGDYYDCLLAAPARGKKLDAFLSWLSQMREKSRLLGVSELIDLVLQTTKMADIFSAMDDGAARAENLALLRAQAVSFEALGNRSLMGFLAQLAQLEQAAGALAAPGGAREDAVQIMSIHKSKGLEFPVVFLADLSRRFNLRDASMGVLLDETLFAGANVVDLRTRSYYPSLARMAIAEKKTMQTIAEELRVLYVAMTRAKEMLIMSYCAAKLPGILKKWNEALELPLPPRTAASALCLGDWVLMTALTKTEAGALFAEAGPNAISRPSEYPWKISFCRASQLAAPTAPTATPAASAPQAPQPLPEMPSPYAYLAASQMPSKLTATALKGRNLDDEAAERTAQATKAPERFRLPRLSAGRAPGAKARGSATHLFMQFASYEACQTKEGIEAELARLVAAHFLSPEQAESVRQDEILALFSSPFGARILHAPELHREFKFSILTDAGEYDPAAKEEHVMLQGVVDCFWIEDGGIVLIDFKTDKTPYGPAERAAHYAPQLNAYAKALSRMYGLPVREKILYFFSCACAYVLE